MKNKILLLILFFCVSNVYAQEKIKKEISDAADRIESKVIDWRRDFHEHPELGNEEFRTAKIVAAHLRSLGMEVHENIAVTGVLGILKGDKPGPVVALRTDMDALPVTERVNLPFKSTAKAMYNGQEVGVMHACGHDSHMAMLMGAAEILVGMKKDLTGTVKFIFQPAEEGVSAKPGEAFGAKGMVREGVLENPKVDAVFGIHINSPTPAGSISYRPGPTMAASDRFEITVKGKQTHGGYPWDGVDAITTSAQIINSLQTIVSRNAKLTEAAAVVTVGSIIAGNRNNIIPETSYMQGTIRTLTREQRELIHARFYEIVEGIAKANRCEAETVIHSGYPVTHNNEELTAMMLPTLIETVGKENLREIPPVMGAEDFSFYQEQVPGLFFFLGGRNPKINMEEAPPHHTPDFYLDESGFKNGVKAFCNLVFDYGKIYNSKN